MASNLTLDTRLTKAEAELELAQGVLVKLQPTDGSSPGHQAVALGHLAKSLESILKVLRDWEPAQK